MTNDDLGRYYKSYRLFIRIVKKGELYDRIFIFIILSFNMLIELLTEFHESYYQTRQTRYQTMFPVDISKNELIH